MEKYNQQQRQQNKIIKIEITQVSAASMLEFEIGGIKHDGIPRCPAQIHLEDFVHHRLAKGLVLHRNHYPIKTYLGVK